MTNDIKSHFTTNNLANAFLILSVVVAVVFGIRYISGVLTPLLVSFIIAITLRPLFNLFKGCIGKEKTNQFYIDFPIFVLTMLVPVLVLYAVYRQINTDVIEQLKSILGDILPYIKDLIENAKVYLSESEIGSNEIMLERLNSLQDSLGTADKANFLTGFLTLLSNISVFILQSMGSVGKGFFSFTVSLATWIVLPQFIYYIMKNKIKREKASSSIAFFTKGNDELNEVLSKKFILFRDIMESYFQKQTLAVIMYILVFSISLSWTDIKYPIVLGMFFGLLNYFPNLGTIALGLLTTALTIFGNVGLGYLVAVIVILITAYIIDEKIITKGFKKLSNSHIHQGIMIFFILFWGALLNGLLGMLLAIPLTIFFKVTREGITENKEVLLKNANLVD